MTLARRAKTLYRSFLADSPLAVKTKTALDYWTLAARYRERFSDCEPRIQQILRHIETRGYDVIPGFWDRERCARAAADTEAMLATRNDFVHQSSDLRVYGAEYLSASIKQFAEDPLLDLLAERYFGGFQAFTLANTITFTPGNLGSGEGWHRDGFHRELKAILYLTDCGEANGPFQILERSNNFTEVIRAVDTLKLQWRQNRLVDRDADIRNQYGDRVKTLAGAAGTLLVFDTSCIHRGAPIESGMRTALTNYCWHRHYYPGPQLRDVIDSYKLPDPDAVYRKCLAMCTG